MYGQLEKIPDEETGYQPFFGCNAAIFGGFLAKSVHQQLWKLSIFHEVLLFLLLLPFNQNIQVL